MPLSVARRKAGHVLKSSKLLLLHCMCEKEHGILIVSISRHSFFSFGGEGDKLHIVTFLELKYLGGRWLITLLGRLR